MHGGRPPTTTTTGVAWIALATFVAALAAEHLLQPRLSPLTHQMSEYATGPDGVLATAGFLAWSLSLAATGRLALRAESSRVLATLFALAAIGMATVACFKTQTVAGVVPAGGAVTLTGRLHDLGSAVTTLAIFCAMLASALTRGLSRNCKMLAVGMTVAAFSVNLALLAVGSEVGGLRQRLLVIIACAWQSAFLLALRRTGTVCSQAQGRTT